MISSLAGNVSSIEGSGVEIDVGGVGYFVFAPASVVSQSKIGARLRLFTQMIVREDALSLYGFLSSDERETFRTLTSVTGVGPRIALAVLSSFDTMKLRKVVAAQDADMLSTVPGIGKRLAQRLLLELKEKLGPAVQQLVPSSKTAEVRDALMGLGYSASELREVLDRVASDDLGVEEIVKAALKELAKV